MGLGCKDLNLYHTKARYLSEMFWADVHLGTNFTKAVQVDGFHGEASILKFLNCLLPL